MVDYQTLSDGELMDYVGIFAHTGRLPDTKHAEFIDQVEVGRRVAGDIRVALEVDDAPAVTAALAGAGATVLAEPTRTPWNSLNSRLDAPGGLQLTLFTELGPDA